MQIIPPSPQQFYDALPQVDVGEDTVPVVDGDDITFKLSDHVGTQSDLSATLNRHATLTSARLCTITPLPTCTYNNGTSGLGATLTADANGVLADIDFTTPALGDYVLVDHQATKAHNGLYKVTDPGSVSTPWVLTRAAIADQTADFADGIVIEVSAGITCGSRRYTAFPYTVTVGTTDIGFRRVNQIDRRRPVDEDFGGFLSDIVVAGGADQVVPGTNFGVSLIGTAAKASQVGNTEILNGVIALDTGSTATGSAGVANGWQMGGGFAFDTSEHFDYSVRWRIPTPSTAGVHEFRCHLGALDSFAIQGKPPLRGLYLLAPEDGASGTYDAVAQMSQTAETSIAWARSSATITVTRNAHGLAVGDTIYAAATSDAAAIPVAAYYVLTVPTANTFTVLGLAGGGASGTITLWRCPRTVVDTGITVSALGNRRLRIRYNGATGNAFFYVDTAGVMGHVATISTNIPSAVTLSIGAAITKTVGTSGARQLYVDRISALHHEPRAAMEMIAA